MLQVAVVCSEGGGGGSLRVALGYWFCCAKCGHGYGWQGKYTDMPPCPKCGDRPDLATLQRLQQIHEIIAASQRQDK
jgi:hypothetical protein